MLKLTDYICLGTAVHEDEFIGLRLLNKLYLGKGAAPSYVDVLLSGVSPLVLTNALGLNYLKLFGGTEQRNLPSEYTQVEYLESSGTQYIDTGIVLKSKATVTTVGQFVSIPQTTAPLTMWGFMGSNNNLPRWGCSIYSNKWLMDLNFTSQSPSLPFANTNKHTFVNETNGTTTYDSFVDGVSIYGQVLSLSSVADYQANTLTAYLFARNNSNVVGNFSSSRIYSFNIVQDDVEVINLIPCKRNSDSVLGMYDTVTGNFLTNAGTGTFTAGADTVPTPDTPMDIVSNNGVLKLSPNLVEFNETRINSSTWDSADKTKGFEVYADVYSKSIGSSMLTNANAFGVFVPCKQGESISLDFFDYEPFYTRCLYCEITADRKCNTTPQAYENAGVITQKTFTLTKSDSIGFIIEWWLSGQQTRNYTASNYMIVKGSTPPTKFIPYGEIYADGTQETVTITGKNLFDGTITHFAFVASNQVVTYSPAYMGITVPVEAGKTYTFSRQYLPNSKSTNRFNFYFTQEYPSVGVQVFNTFSASINSLTHTFTVPNDMNYVAFYFDVGGVDISNTQMMVELGSTATSYEPYFNGGTATAEMLLKVGDYKDEQSVIDGAITRNIGITVLNGTEGWGVQSNQTSVFYCATTDEAVSGSKAICSHYTGIATSVPFSNMTNNTIKHGHSTNNSRIYVKDTRFTIVSEFEQFLANQYNAGTPVIVVYPTSSSVTETVTGQPLTVQQGTNIVTITQASIDNLTMELSYKAGAVVTVTEIQNAQLSNSVEVTIQ